MISVLVSFLSSMWTAMGTSLANHLWQSTLFAIAAGLLAVALRNNHARVRYWLWLSASVKFLIPFSLLIVLGSHLEWLKPHVTSRPAFSYVMQHVGAPFVPTVSTERTYMAVTPTATAVHLLPTLALALWLCGCIGVVFYWCLRWRRMTAPIREIPPLQTGRELEALRRLERKAGGTARMPLIVSPSALEPGVMGIFHQVFVLPAGIAERLTDAQLQAIIMHELCHARRRDNLTAAAHMLCESIFWFHPLVWWIGARLVEERERACDEEVLRLGSEPRVYAESILQVCKFYLESPLVCAAGVTGSNLKKRIEEIMTHRISRNLNFTRKFLLASLALATLVTPLAVGFLAPTPSRAQSQPEAPVSSVPGAVTVTPLRSGFIIPGPGSSEWKMSNVTLSQLIQRAYGLKAPQIIGPAWLTTNRYDIGGKVEAGSTALQVHLQSTRELQAVLANQFKLKFHRETRDIPMYELVVAKNGLKMKEVPLDKTNTAGLFMVNPSGHMTGAKVSTQELANPFLSDLTGQFVVDKTGLKGVYDVAFDWTWGDNPSILTALQEQLGLELKAETGPVEVLVVDRAEPVTTGYNTAAANHQ